MTRHVRRTAIISGVLLGVLVLVAVAAPWVAPYPPNAQLDILALKSQAPSLAHPFGTDQASRDVLSRVLHGARVSLLVAGSSVAISVLAGLTFGMTAALAGGVVESVMLRLLDLLQAIPRLLVLVAVSALVTAMPLPALALLIGLTGWFDVARLVRGETAALLTREFVLAARASGVGGTRLLWRHVLPHLLPIITVSATLGIAHTIALESGLSYLGLGVQDPTASWGTIIRDGNGFVDTLWWLTLFPGLATVLAVLVCNALGDALRDLFASEQVPA